MVFVTTLREGMRRPAGSGLIITVDDILRMCDVVYESRLPLDGFNPEPGENSHGNGITEAGNGLSRSND